MPLYQYAPDCGDCLQCGGRFDQTQKLAEPALQQCPYCGKAVHREICSVGLCGMSGPRTNDVERAGFTQYKRSAQGVYERSSGPGPDTLVSD